MTTPAYEWGGRSYAVPAELVGTAVARIATKEGACPPGRLVQEAAKATSPLHPLFTWDNAMAAERWRTHEARQVINSIRITVTIEGQAQSVPAFVSVGHTVGTMERGEGYRPVAVVMEDPQWSVEALQQAANALNTLRRRYGDLSALTPVWDALDGVMDTQAVAAD